MEKNISLQVKLLDKEFPNLSSLTNDDKSLLVTNISTNYIVKVNSTDYCGRSLNNCIADADAVLALETAACIGAVFVPVVGPACELAAIYQHYHATDECYNQKSQCRGIL